MRNAFVPLAIPDLCEKFYKKNEKSRRFRRRTRSGVLANLEIFWRDNVGKTYRDIEIWDLSLVFGPSFAILSSASLNVSDCSV